MESLFKRHDAYLSRVPMEYIRDFMQRINWNSRLLVETFFANQLASAGHKVEYAGYKKGDFRIDGDIVIEVGGQDKGFSQISGQENAYVAADDIESAYMGKIPLWVFGFLY